MKSNFFTFLLAAFSIVLFSACSNDDNPGDGISEGNCTLSWSLDGQSDNASPTVCVFLDNTLNMGLIGSDGIQLQLNNLTATGTYNFGSNDAVVLLKDSNDNTLGGGTGTVTVTELSSSKVKGTFSGSFFDIQDINQTMSFQVTNGQFTANL